MGTRPRLHFLIHASAGVTCAAALLLVCAPGKAAPAPIQVSNLTDGTTLRYPVAFLRGDVGVPDGTELRLKNDAGREAKTAVLGGHFKALIELSPGENHLTLTAGEAHTDLALTFTPPTSRYFVRVIYLTDSSGDTAYQSERAQDPQDYAAKLDTAAKLLQTFTAERMNDLGHGSRTFNLELGKDGRVVVHTVRGPLPAAVYQTQDGNRLWSETRDYLNRTMPNRYAKNMVLMAFTRFDPVSRTARAHTALGGDNLGLFGSAGMFSWPSRIQDAQAAFSDATRVDATRTHDDSAFRNTYWGLASTTMGAVLHEMSHTLGLPHTNDPEDIMSRGFDHLNRFFTLLEPPSGRRSTPYPFTEKEIAYFAPISATRLAASRWLQPDNGPAPRP